SGAEGDRGAGSAEVATGKGDAATAPEPANDNEPVPMSLDRDASDRTLDRQLAHLGLLDDAAPLFREGSSVPGVGVLLALPWLVESGLIRISRNLYGEIGSAFYGLRTQTPLHDTADELCKVANALNVRPENVMVGAKATEAALKTLSEQVKLAGYRIVHF